MESLDQYLLCGEEESLKGLYGLLLEEVTPYLGQGYIRGIPEPRLTAALALDEGIVDFEYSGRKVHPHFMDPLKMPTLSRVSQIVEEFCRKNDLPRCNGVYVNWYRTPQDSIGWHSDKEISAEKFYVISMTSNEKTARTFHFKRKSDKKLFTRDLEDGEIVAMLPGCQDHFLHSLPSRKFNTKRERVEGGRLNLTFRCFRTN